MRSHHSLLFASMLLAIGCGSSDDQTPVTPKPDTSTSDSTSSDSSGSDVSDSTSGDTNLDDTKKGDAPGEGGLPEGADCTPGQTDPCAPGNLCCCTNCGGPPPIDGGVKPIYKCLKGTSCPPPPP